MKRYLILLFITILAGGFANKLTAKEVNLILQYNYYVMANDPGNMIDVLRSITKDNEGYVKYFSNNKIVIRLSSRNVDTIRAYINETGFIADERLYRKDVSETLLDLNTRLRVKQKLLNKLYDIFNNSRLAQTLDVEREVGKVVMEIESIKGKIAYYRDRISLTEITINVNQSSTSSIKRRKASTQWDWVRKLGIENLIIGF